VNRPFFPRTALSLLAVVIPAGLSLGCRTSSRLAEPSAPVRGLDAPRVIEAPLEARPLLLDVPSRAMLSGAGPLAIVASGAVVEGERVGAFVEVPAEACLLAYARASASLEDIDIAVFTEEGIPIALDESPDPKPTVLVCPPHPDRLYVALHASTGEGLAVIAAHLVPQAAADAVSNTVGAKGTVKRAAEAWPGLDALVRTHRAQLGGSWREMRRIAVPGDPRVPSAVSLSIGDGECVDALIVPDEEVSAVEAELVDASGRMLARAKDPSHVRTLTVCTKSAVTGALQIRPHAGRGPIAIVLSRALEAEARELSARPEMVWISANRSLNDAETQRNQELKARGYATSSLLREGSLAQGQRRSVPLELPRVGHGACARIDVLAGEPLAAVEANLWSPSGDLRAANTDTDGAVLFGCGGGSMRLDLGTRGRAGPFRVLVRPEPWTDASFSRFPLAASRMLERLALGPSHLFEGEAKRVRYAKIVADRRDTFETKLEPGACLVVGLGVEGQGTGLELRVFDATSNDELDRAHGHRAAFVRACAGPEGRVLRIETRATSGVLDGVFGERLTAAARSPSLQAP
jgi:hypothetical protein